MTNNTVPSHNNRSSSASRVHNEIALESSTMSAAKGSAQHKSNSNHSFHREFRDLDIAVFTARDEAGEQLLRELQRTRARVQHIWPIPELIPTSYDVIYCDLLDDLPQRLPWLPGKPEAALVVIAAPMQLLDLTLLHNCAPHAVIHQPVTAQAALASLLVGRGHFLYERRLRGRVDKLDDNLRTMRSVERAKAILMQSRSISEEEAYQYLRRHAMERRVTIGTLANVIVDSQELLG
jgi:two-component system, response regulator / RNA-binding antiterminator